MDKIVAIISWIGNNLGIIIGGLLAIVGGCAVIAKVTPTQADDNFFAKVLEILNKIALPTDKHL